MYLFFYHSKRANSHRYMYMWGSKFTAVNIYLSHLLFNDLVILRTFFKTVLSEKVYQLVEDTKPNICEKDIFNDQSIQKGF